MNELTVIMPVYNAMPYLPAAIDSILGQTLRDFELLIVDDGSTDGSGDYLRSLSDSRVHVVAGEHVGLTAAKNSLIERVRTTYCAFMDADDIAQLNRLETQLAFMRAHRDVVLAGSQINMIGNGGIVRATPFPTTHEDLMSSLLKSRAVICHPSCIARTESLRAAGMYRLRYAEEFDLFFRLARCGRLANVDSVLFNYRIHLGSTFTTYYLENKCYSAYAIATHRAWQTGQPAPQLDEFVATWHRCGRGKTLARAIDRWSAIQYRRAILELGKGRRLAAAAKMAFAAGCRPRTFASQIVARLRRKIAQAAA